MSADVGELIASFPVPTAARLAGSYATGLGGAETFVLSDAGDDDASVMGGTTEGCVAAAEVGGVVADGVVTGGSAAGGNR